MYTNEAFETMINTRGIYKTLQLAKGTVGSMRNAMRTGKDNISMDKKIELLKKSGFQVVQEMQWHPPAID